MARSMKPLTIAASWACYELDAELWSDETTHVFRRSGADGSGETWIVHRDPEGDGVPPERYARAQEERLRNTLPDFTLHRIGPRADAGAAGHELAFAWTSPKGPVEQVQVYIPGPSAMLILTLTGLPRLSPVAIDALAHALATLRVARPGAGGA